MSKKKPKIERLITQRGYSLKHGINEKTVSYHVRRGNYETITTQCGKVLIVDED